MAYTNDTKPSNSYSNDTKPTLGAFATWATILTTWATEAATWATVYAGTVYSNDSKPS